MPTQVTSAKGWWGEELQRFKHDGLGYSVRVARKGVPAPLDQLSFVWSLWTRIRWQFSARKRWTVEILRDYPRMAGIELVAVEHFPTRQAARDRAGDIVAQRLVPLVDWSQLQRPPRPTPRP
jgi:hypothetical protein